MRVTAMGALLGGLLLGALATAQVQSGTPGTSDGQPAMQDAGKAIFEGKGNCWVCHGKDARGTPLGPNLSDGKWLHIAGKLEEIVSIVRTGVAKPKAYPAPMPPLGGVKLNDSEIAAVARYVHSLNVPRPD
jgi:mono/diheme cytochrome c family protein